MLRGPHGARSSHSFSPEASLCVISRWFPLPLLAVQGHMLTAHLLGARLGLLSLRQSGVSTHIPWSRRSFWEKSVRPSASSMGAVPFAPRALSPPPSPALSFMKTQSQHPPHPRAPTLCLFHRGEGGRRLLSLLFVSWPSSSQISCDSVFAVLFGLAAFQMLFEGLEKFRPPRSCYP